MKRPNLAIATFCIVLIFTGGILRNWIPLSLDWQHDIGQISILLGVIGLVKIIIKPVRDKSDK